MTQAAALIDPSPPRAGHNNPPEPTIAETLAEVYAVEVGKIEAIADRANKAPKKLESDDDLMLVGDIVIDARDLSKSLEGARENEKKPYLAGGRAVDAHFKAPIERLKRIADGMGKLATEFNRAKAESARREREAQERAARAAAEAARFDAEVAAAAGDADASHASHAASDPPVSAEADADRIATDVVRTADLTRVRSESGTVATTRTEWAFEVQDYNAIPLDDLRPYLEPAAIDKAIRGMLRVKRGAAKLAGVRFFENETAQFRR